MCSKRLNKHILRSCPNEAIRRMFAALSSRGAMELALHDAQVPLACLIDRTTINTFHHVRRSSKTVVPRSHQKSPSLSERLLLNVLLLLILSESCASAWNSDVRFGSVPTQISSLLGKVSNIASIMRITQSSLKVSIYGDCSTINPLASASEA